MADETACQDGHLWQAQAGDSEPGQQSFVCAVCGLVQVFPFTDESTAVEADPNKPVPPSPDPFSAPTVSMNKGDTPGADEKYPTSTVAEAEIIPGYQILRELGRGGMGVVYKARQTSLKRLVALKMILAGPHAAVRDLDRFRSEAEAVARLQHPNIVQIYEIGQHNGLDYFSLEYIEGGNLAKKIKGKPLPALEAARIGEELARAIQYCHQRGIIHRDLKPGNVLLTRDGMPKITDFGLAKLLEREAGHTRSGLIMGTPSYMAPEQTAGRTRDIGPHTDTYALGAILYEMLTGRPPFKADTVLETMGLVASQEPVPPSRWQPRVPRDLETICLKALAKDPGRRYHSALVLAQDLERFQAGESILARREGLVGKLWRKVRRRPLTVGLFLALIAVATGAIVYFAQLATLADRMNALAQKIDDGLEVRSLASTHFQNLAELAGELEKLSPERGASARRRLHQQFAQWIRAAFSDKPTLQTEDIQRIRSALDLLAEADPVRERPLREQFENRLRAPQRILAWENPERTEPSLQPSVWPDCLVLSQAPCRGHVQIKAVFEHPSWGKASQVGLLLNAVPKTKKCYSFLITTPAYPDLTGGGPQVKRMQAAGVYQLQILHNGVRLREQQLQIPEGNLTLQASRAGDRLSFQVNNLPPVIFDDVFPPTGVDVGFFGLCWPEGVRLLSVEAKHQALPADPSPLERGDDCFAREQFAEAADHFRAQADSARDLLVGQEARCKMGLCFAELRQYGEAARLFEQLAAEPGDRWPLFAQCQLWLIRLRQKRFADADAIFKHLSSHYTFEQLAVCIPDDVRERILDAFRGEDIHQKIKVDPLRIGNLERALAIENLFETPAEVRGDTQRLLIEAHHAADHLDQAAQLAEKLLASPTLSPRLRFWTTADYAWLQIRRGEPEKALAEINRQMERLGPVSRYLLIERTRVLAALNRWPEAEKDLDDFFRQSPPKTFPFAEACLLRGFLRERRGDSAGAQEAWRQGWQAAQETKEFGTMLAFILASLSGDLSEADTERMIGRALGLIANNSPIVSALKLGQFSTPFVTKVFRETWRSSRGKEYARRIAFRNVSLSECYGIQLPLTVAEAMHQGAVTGPLTPEQDALIWKVVYDDLFRGYLKGTISEWQLFPGVMVWGGRMDYLGWGALSANFGSSIRGPLAYIYGCRMLRLEPPQPEDAATLFRSAVRDAPADSPLRRLAQAELDRLNK
jgi:tRNA A-37 threonylcarbamoyl transferase component Bud32/tetratricopeptide (TPR) repeat protein